MVRRLVSSLLAAAIVFPTAFVAVVAVPASPAEAYPFDWWVDGGWGIENDPEYGTAEMRVCYYGGWWGSLPVTIDYATRDGSAIAGLDYVATSGTLVFVPGVDHCKTVEITILDDELWEMENDLEWGWGERYFVDLSNPSLGAPEPDDWSVGIGHIEDDYDDWPTALVADDRTVTEGEHLTVPIRIDWEKSYPITVHWETVPVSAGDADFVGQSGDITFEPGESRKYVGITTIDDALNEGAEQFRVVLSRNEPAHRTWIYKGATLTLRDNDPLPKVSVADVAIAVPSGAPAEVPFEVSLDAPSGRDVTVAYETRDGSAVAGRDYTHQVGSVTFPAGVTSGTVRVPVTGSGGTDDAKTFGLALSDPAHAEIGRAEARAEVIETRTDAPPPAPTEPAPAPAPPQDLGPVSAPVTDPAPPATQVAAASEQATAAPVLPATATKATPKADRRKKGTTKVRLRKPISARRGGWAKLRACGSGPQPWCGVRHRPPRPRR